MGALATRGYDVLLVDIDYHGGLTCSLGYSELYYHTDRTTLFDVLDFDRMESVNDIVVEQRRSTSATRGSSTSTSTDSTVLGF